MASSITKSPRFIRRSATASANTSGIEAAEVLPVPVRREDHLLRGEAAPAGDAVDDPLVGLVGHKPVDAIRLKAGLLKRSFNRFRYRTDRTAENLAAIHAQLVERMGAAPSANSN